MATPTTRNISGTGYKALQVPNKNPEQMALFRQLIGGSGQNIEGMLSQLSGLASGGDEETWRKLEAPSLRQFAELQGGIASRFSGMGTGARRSSGFQNTASGAAADLAERLQSQRLGLQQGAQDRLMQLYQQLLGQDTFSTGLIPKRKKPWEELLGSFSSGLGSGLGGLI